MTPARLPYPLLAAALVPTALAGCGGTEAEGDDDDDSVGSVIDDDSTDGGDDDSAPPDEWGPIDSFDWRTPHWDDDPQGDGSTFDIRNWRYRTNGVLIEWTTVPYGSVDPEEAPTGLFFQAGAESMQLVGDGLDLTATRYDADGVVVDDWVPKSAYPVEAEGGVGFGGEIWDLGMFDNETQAVLPGLSAIVFTDYDLFPDPESGYYVSFTASLGPPAPDLELDALVVVDDFNGDGALSAGETGGLRVDATNLGDAETGGGVQAVVAIVSNSTAAATLDVDAAPMHGGASLGPHDSGSSDVPGLQITVDPGALTSQFISLSVIARYPDGTEEGMGTMFFTIN